MADPRTLSAVSGEAAPPSASVAPAPSSTPVVVPRLPGTPDLTSEGLYVFSGGGIELAVDPTNARVRRLALDGKNAVIPAADSPGNFTAELEGSTLVLKGALGQRTKRFRLDTARRSVEVTYTLTNETTETTRHTGLSDVYRVPSAGGLTFFPGAPQSLVGSTLKLNVWQRMVWFSHDQAREPKALEASFDSTEGWVASVSDGLVLVTVFGETQKPFVKLASAYDATTKQRPWVEIEQTAVVDLSPGSSMTTTVRLFLRKLPPSIAAKPGNQELVGFVRGIIQ